jgi:hypothetical protein
MNGKNLNPAPINEEQAVRLARAKVGDLTYIDPNNVLRTHFLSRAVALADGVPDGPQLRDEWLIDFARIETGHVTDGMFDSLTVSVDAETGKVQIQESF